MHPVRYQNMLVSARLGGAERLAIDIHRYVAKQRPGSAELLVPEGAEAQRHVVADRLDHQPFRLEAVMSPRRLESWGANANLYRRMATHRQALLHVHSPFVYGALRPLRSLGRMRTILHLHLDYSQDQLRWALQAPPDLVLVCARFMRDRVLEMSAVLGRPAQPVAVAVNAVDLQRYQPGDRAAVRQRLGLSPVRPIILMAANLAEHKGQLTALRALAILRQRGHEPLLWLVGEEREAGGYTEKLQRACTELGVVDLVEFLGFRNDVPQLMQAADFLLLPSKQEGLPLSILEAQASKVVVLAAPTAGIPEVVEHERTGLLIGADDAEGYAARLISLLEKPAQAEAIAAAALRQVSANYGLEQYCGNMLAHYDELLGQRSNGGAR
jgi:glycosyltransferase involved in cell wall biosynthesis